MVTSSAVVGSSAMITSGSLAIAMAIITRWRIPPENSCGNAPARCCARGMPTSSSSSTARRIAASLEMSLWTRTASAIWWPTVYTGVSADSGSWKIIAMLLPRRRAKLRSSSPASSWPLSRTEPSTRAVAGSKPITARADADLPEPDSPTIPSTSPRASW
jgi:hypothetical protein